jgi:hypothetical protein
MHHRCVEKPALVVLLNCVQVKRGLVPQRQAGLVWSDKAASVLLIFL